MNHSVEIGEIGDNRGLTLDGDNSEIEALLERHLQEHSKDSSTDSNPDEQHHDDDDERALLMS